MIRFSTRVAVAVFVGVIDFAPRVLAQVNQPPVADAGADVSVFLGESAILTASATDADGDPIESWNWAIDSQPAGSSASFSPSGVPQTVIFAAPFSNFVLAGLDNDDDDEDEDGVPDDLNPNKYKFKRKYINVEIDIRKGRISVHRKKLNLAGFDPTGGTVVDFSSGTK